MSDIELMEAYRAIEKIDQVFLTTKTAFLDAVSKLVGERPPEKEINEFLEDVRDMFNHQLFYEIRQPYLEEIRRIERDQEMEFQRQERTYL